MEKIRRAVLLHNVNDEIKRDVYLLIIQIRLRGSTLIEEHTA